jgi:hypothetical protein
MTETSETANRRSYLDQFGVGKMVAYGARVATGGRAGDIYSYYARINSTSPKGIKLIFSHADVRMHSGFKCLVFLKCDRRWSACHSPSRRFAQMSLTEWSMCQASTSSSQLVFQAPQPIPVKTTAFLNILTKTKRTRSPVSSDLNFLKMPTFQPISILHTQSGAFT